MADNYTTNAGSGGDTFAADDVGGVKYPVVKLDLGGDGASSPVSSALPVSQSGAWSISITGTVAATQSGAWSVAQSGTWTVQPGNTQNTTPWLVKEGRSSTGTVTVVADTATSTTILASNANRLGAAITNDSSALLYLLVGSGTASATNYTARVYQNGYYEVPACYTGVINGIWATDPGDGAARVTEFT